MRERYSQLTKDVLLYVAMAGAITIAATSPSFTMHIIRNILDSKKFGKQIEKWKLARAIRRLKRNRLIILKEGIDGKCTVELTEQGKRKTKAIQLDSLSIPKPKTWDGKWRVVIFDIPEEKLRIGRDALRAKLQELGFLQLQKSVWVLPWPCENEILFLGELYNITPFINILTAEHIYDDIRLRKYFTLL